MDASASPEDSPFADAALARTVQEINGRGGAPGTAPSIDEMRRGGEARAAAREPGPALAAVDDIVVPATDGSRAVPVRVYRPVAGAAPVLVHAHGGGWTIGSIETHDRICRRLAARSGAVVVSVGYRLAPEHPAPAAVDDVVHVLSWVAGRPTALGAVTGRVGVAGDSAGGTLAALACLRLRDAGASALPDVQVLVYSNTDLTGPGASMQEKAHGWGLDVEAVEHFNRQWVPDAARWSEPTVSPLRASDLQGLPAAVVVTAEHDPLRDQAELYADRLREAGVRVVHRREERQVHNFLMYDLASPACAAAGDRLADDVAEALR